MTLDRITFLKKKIAELKAAKKKMEEEKKLQKEYDELRHPWKTKVKEAVSNIGKISDKKPHGKRKPKAWDFGLRPLSNRDFGL